MGDRVWHTFCASETHTKYNNEIIPERHFARELFTPFCPFDNFASHSKYGCWLSHTFFSLIDNARPRKNIPPTHFVIGLQILCCPKTAAYLKCGIQWKPTQSSQCSRCVKLDRTIRSLVLPTGGFSVWCAFLPINWLYVAAIDL